MLTVQSLGRRIASGPFRALVPTTTETSRRGALPNTITSPSALQVTQKSKQDSPVPVSQTSAKNRRKGKKT
jgi:hypothetical protein